jgi:Rab3 GTPase-activating protein catalytic subunit
LSENPKLYLMELSLVSKAKSALQNVAAKAERVLTEIKADIKADFGQPTSPDDIARLNGRHNHDAEFNAEFPWSAKNDNERRYEAEFKRRIMDLSKKPDDFLKMPNDEHESVDMHTAMTSVGNVLEVDEVLKELWFQYVPKEMKELDFWRRYFIAVKRIRQEVINADSDNSVGRSWSNIERRLNFGGIGNESLRKDPLEEAAYKEAFSVITVPPSMIVRRLAAAIE